MLIELRTLPSGRSTLSQRVTLDEEQCRNTGIQGPVVCDAEIDRLSVEIMVNVTFTGSVTLECARCMKTFTGRCSGSYHIILRNVDIAPLTEEDADSVDYSFTEDDLVVDTRQSLYDEIMTGIPLMPLCGESCPGISVDDSAIHIDSETEHGEKAIDPRWEALRKLRDADRS